MRHIASLLLVLALQAVPALSADFTYTGAIAQDDERRQFNFTLAQPATVIIRTYSYAGGVNAAGTQVSRGGFDPTLSVFDSKGNLFAVNRDGDCAHVATDSVTAYCFDSYIEQQFPAGTWQLVLTQSENLPNGPTLADSFSYDGSGNFTADPDGASNPGFWDFFPNRRTGEYTLEIRGADSSQTSLDPSIGGIVNGASFAGGDAAPNTILTLIDPQLHGDSSVTLTVGGLNAQVLYAGASQINFVVPPGVTQGEGVPIEVWRGTNLLLSTAMTMTDAAPALFTFLQTGSGNAAVLNVSESGAATPNGGIAPASPAARGSYIEVYGTGFGAANAANSDGLSLLASAVTATIGGVPAQVTFAGIAPKSTLGLQQINVLVPEDAPVGPAVPIRLRIGTHTTQTGTTIAVK
jgi:uncharacterized protein (TIGR03437 family)